MKLKSNDSIPDDEMLLAEAIAAARASGVAWTQGAWFRDDTDRGESLGWAFRCAMEDQ